MGELGGTIVSVVGEDHKNLRFLFNIYYEPLDPNEIISVVAAGRHKPDVYWETIHHHESWLTAMGRSPGGHLFAVSADGKLHTDRSGKWEVIDLNCPDGLNALWVKGDDELIAVGNAGTRVHYDSGQVSVDSDTRKRRLSAVHGMSGNHIIAVGDNGFACKFDGWRWSELDSGTDENLLAVNVRNRDETYVSGSGGALLRQEGDGFRQVAKQIAGNLSGFVWFGDRLYVVAGPGGVFRLEESKLEHIKDINLYRADIIGGTLFGWGNKLLAQYDGAEWWGGNLDFREQE